MVCFAVERYDDKYWLGGGANTQNVDWRDLDAQKILYSSDGGSTWNDDTPTNAMRGAILTFKSFDGKLFAGSLSRNNEPPSVRKATVREYDGSGWTQSWSGHIPPGPHATIETMTIHDKRLYFHVTDRHPEGQRPTAPPPSQASNSATVGSIPRALTIWLDASDHGDLAGVHARFELPRGWRLERGDEQIGGHQLFANARGYDADRAELVTAFDGVQGGSPVAVGRLDVRAQVSGSLAMSNAGARAVDCSHRTYELPQGGTHGFAGVVVTADEPVVSVRRLSSVAGRCGAAFEIDTDHRAMVSGSVYGALGRLVKRLSEDTSVAPGKHVLTWDGTTSNGSSAASGVYFVDLWVGAKHFVERTYLLR